MATVETPRSGPEGPGGAGGELFVRKSSGLVREIGARDSFGIALGIVILVSLFSGSAIFMQVFPHSDMYVPLLVGAAVSLLLGFVYIQLVGVFPRSGGEYVYASRTFGPVIGAAVGGAVLVAACINDGSSIIQSSQVFVPFAASTVGDALGIHGLETFASGWLSTKTGYVVVSLITVAIFAIAAMRPIGTIAKWIFWAFAAGLLAYVTVLLLLLVDGHSGFVKDFNAASTPDAYDKVIATSREGGFVPGIRTEDVIAMVPFGALLFVGFTFGNYAAGEFKRPLKTYKLTVFAALGAAAVAYFLGWMVLRSVVGLDFMQASANLAASDPDAYSELTSIPQVQGGLAYGVLASGDPVTKLIIGLGAQLAIFANAGAYFILISRIVFALSFDRLLPTKMAEVRQRTHAPIYAIALVATGVGTYSVLANLTTLTTVFRNLVLIIYGIFVIGCICVAALPYRRRDLFAASPKVINGTFLGIPIVTILGVAGALIFAALDVVLATKKEYSGGYSTGSIITLVVLVTFGIALYLVSRLNLGRRGIDVRLAMRELPPE